MNCMVCGRSVESLSGRIFEATFKDEQPASRTKVSAQPLSTSKESALDDAIDSATATSFRIVTRLGKGFETITGLILGGILFALIYYNTPAKIAAIVPPELGLPLIFVFAFFLGFVIARGLHRHLFRYRLVTAPDGLYATVPFLFPGFTPWHNLRDFTLTDGKSTRTRKSPLRRVTLWTREASYSFECIEIENEDKLAYIMLDHLPTSRQKR